MALRLDRSNSDTIKKGTKATARALVRFHKQVHCMPSTFTDQLNERRLYGRINYYRTGASPEVREKFERGLRKDSSTYISWLKFCEDALPPLDQELINFCRGGVRFLRRINFKQQKESDALRRINNLFIRLERFKNTASPEEVDAFERKLLCCLNALCTWIDVKNLPTLLPLNEALQKFCAKGVFVPSGFPAGDQSPTTPEGKAEKSLYDRLRYLWRSGSPEARAAFVEKIQKHPFAPEVWRLFGEKMEEAKAKAAS